MNTELEDNIKSALSSNPALRDKILALIPAKNSVVTPDTEWETVDRYSVETGLLKRFFKLYEEGRKTGDPQNFIDYFKAEHYLLIEVGKAISSRDTYWKERVEAYNELILAVESKCEGETRHQTALRYIKQAEQRPELASEAMCGECLKSMESGAIIYPRRTCPFHATPITNEDNLK